MQEQQSFGVSLVAAVIVGSLLGGACILTMLAADMLAHVVVSHW